MARGKVMVTIICAASILSLSDSAVASEDSAGQVPPTVAERLEALITVYTMVYYAVGACDGFIEPQDEAPFDPYGPALAKWPDSFKRQMAETREEGKIEGARLAKQNSFTFEERAELCRRQLDSAKADLDRVRTRYGASQ